MYSYSLTIYFLLLTYYKNSANLHYHTIIFKSLSNFWFDCCYIFYSVKQNSIFKNCVSAFNNLYLLPNIANLSQHFLFPFNSQFLMPLSVYTVLPFNFACFTSRLLTKTNLYNEYTWYNFLLFTVNSTRWLISLSAAEVVLKRDKRIGICQANATW